MKSLILLAVLTFVKVASSRALLTEVCSGPGLFPVPGKVCVAEFWSCSAAGAAPVPMPCAEGTVFNPATSNCDFPASVRGCPYDPTKCPGPGMWPATPSECSDSFWSCAGPGADPVVMACASGTVFNPMIGSCDFADNTMGCNGECTTVTFALKAYPTLTFLNAAVESANLTAALDDRDLVATVFAPDNAAFISLLRDLDIDYMQLLSPEPEKSEALLKVLLTHVVPGVAANSTSLFNGQVLPTLNGNQTLTVELGESVMIKPEGGDAAEVVGADISLCSAIAHVINAASPESWDISDFITCQNSEDPHGFHN